MALNTEFAAIVKDACKDDCPNCNAESIILTES